MDPTQQTSKPLWQKALITQSQFPTLILREVWAWKNHPMPCWIMRQGETAERQVNFYFVNLKAPYDPTTLDQPALGFTEESLQWLDRGPEDHVDFWPVPVLASTWLHPGWPGL